MDCPTCKFLWDELSQATNDYIATIGKIQVAQIEQDNAGLKELELLKLAASERRARARTAVRKHGATHEGGKAKRQPA